MAKKTALAKGNSALLEQPAPVVSAAGLGFMIHIQLTDLSPSETNPRKSFDELGIIDLAKSMEEIGLLQPITVRQKENGNGYEIIAGERRYRAALYLKWLSIPAFVKNVTDEEILEIQIIENLQREDVSAMEEAVAFKSLLNRESIDWLCTRIHKSKKYVTDRLKLNDLTEECQGYVHSGVLPLTHAIMISKLPVEEQMKCVDKCVDDVFASDKQICVLTIDKLREFIDHQLLVDLFKVSFDLESETLVPTAGSCLNCPKRTCNQNLLFQEITVEDKCTDPSCFHGKVEANLKLSIKTAKEEHGKENVLSGAIAPYSRGMVKVKGVQVPYSETKKKKGEQICVVLTKAEGLNRESLGKTVFIDKKSLTAKTEAKEENKTTGSSSARSMSWAESQKLDFASNIYPRLLQIQNYVNADTIPNTEELSRHFLRERLDRLDRKAVIGLEVMLLGTTSESPEALYQFADGLVWVEKMSLIDKLIDRLLPLGFERIAVILLLIDAIGSDETDEILTSAQRDEEEVSGLNWLEIMNILEPAQTKKPGKRKKGVVA